jgi:hypothetical protein
VECKAGGLDDEYRTGDRDYAQSTPLSALLVEHLPAGLSG